MFDEIRKLLSGGSKKSEDSVMGLYNSVGRQGNSRLTNAQALSFYEQSLYLNKAISKRADKVGEVEFQIKKGGEITDNSETQKILQLLQKPNKYLTGDLFWRTIQKFYDLYGYCIIVPEYDDKVFKKGALPDSLKILNPRETSIHTNKDETEIIKFTHRSKDYEYDEVIYFYNPSVKTPILPESVILAGANVFELDIDITTYQKNILKNGGRVESIISVKNPINATQLEKLKLQWAEKYAEAENAGQPLFLGSDMEYTQLGLSPRELDFMNTKSLTLSDIVIATGVPKIILGVSDQETYANAEHAIRSFLDHTIKPLLENLVDVLNTKLIDDKYELTFVDPTPTDREQQRKDLELADRVHALTVNEKREWLGYDAIKDGDYIYQPFNLAPLGKEQEKVQPKSIKKKEYTHPLQNKAIRDIYRKQADAQMSLFEDRLLKEVRKVFNDQEKRLIEGLQGNKSLLGEVWQPALEIKLVKDGLLPAIREIYKEQGQNAMDNFGDSEPFNFTTTMENSLNARADMFSESIINTQTDRLEVLFQDTNDRPKLVENIQELYIDISQAKAEMIARTEVHAGMQDANFQAYKQAGLPIKIWVAVGDERTREEHIALDGEERPIDMPFSNGLMYPNEPNCRCSI